MSVLEKPNVLPISPAISVERLIAEFDAFESGALRQLNDSPTSEEMVRLTELDDELMFIIDGENHILVTRGNKRKVDGQANLPVVGINHDVLAALKPKLIAHTHLAQQIGIGVILGTKEYEGALFAESIPGIADLTSPVENVPFQYIFSRFGRTTYWAIPNLGIDPEDTLGLSIVQRQLIIALRGQAVQEIIKRKATGGKDRLNTMGEVLNQNYGCGFKFQTYDEIGDRIFELEKS